MVSDFDDIAAELAMTSENLHRAELTVLQRDEQVARWIELTERRIITACDNSKPGPKSAVNAASSEIGVNRMDAHRAVKVASLSQEAKAAAVEVGLDNNRTALLAAAIRCF